MTELKVTAEPGVPQILTERAFDAPRDLVFRAFTEPDLLAQWLGPRGYTMTIDQFDPRDGGSWRYIHSDGDGNSYGFHGVFHSDPSPDGFVQTFEFEGAPGHVSLDTMVLEERDGRTIVRTNSVFQSVEARDAMVESGMADGMCQGYEQLEELLEKQGGTSRPATTRSEAATASTDQEGGSDAEDQPVPVVRHPGRGGCGLLRVALRRL